jgi:hypothetical protein
VPATKMTSTVNHNGHRLLLLATILSLFASVSAELKTLNKYGLDGLPGWPGLSFHTQRYEPICGSIGHSDYYREKWHWGSYCANAVDSFMIDTDDTVALYEKTGLRLTDTMVGHGKELCMCFALAAMDPDSTTFAVCLYVNPYGAIIVWDASAGYIRGSFRPGIDRALPDCEHGNLAKAETQWSATAWMPSPTQPASTSTTPPPTTRK